MINDVYTNNSSVPVRELAAISMAQALTDVDGLGGEACIILDTDDDKALEVSGTLGVEVGGATSVGVTSAPLTIDLVDLFRWIFGMDSDELPIRDDLNPAEL